MENRNLQIKKSFRNPRNQDFLKMTEIISASIVILLMSILIGGNLTMGFILPLFLIVSSISFLVSFRHPRAGIYAIIFLTFTWERFFTLAPIFIGRQEYKIYSLDIILVAIFLGVGFRIFNSFVKNEKQFKTFKKQIFQHKKIIKYFLVFIFLVGIHFFLDIFLRQDLDRAVAFSSVKYYIFYPLLYLVTIILFDKKEYIKTLFKFSLAGALAIIFFIIYGILNQGGLWTEFTPMSTRGIRIVAFTHGFYLTMAWLGIFIFVVLQKKYEKKYYLWLSIFMVGILGSMMRHLWLGLGLSLGITFFLYFKKENKQFIWKQLKFYLPGFMAGLIVIGYLTVALPYSALNNVTSNVLQVVYERVVYVGGVEGDYIFSWRELAWRETSKQFIKQPLYGLGFGRQIYLETANYHDFVEVRNIHNSWLVLIVQLGVFVSGAFFLFFFNVIKIIFSTIREKLDWLNLTIGILIVNYIFIALFQPYLETNMLVIFFWILLGLATNLDTVKAQTTKEKKNILSDQKNYNTVIKKMDIGRITFKK
jgi:hypothetical protein